MNNNVTTLELSTPSKFETNTVVFSNIKSGGEMLKIAEDGFYVRGVKVPEDEKEARLVYTEFLAWMKTTRMV